MKKIQQKMDVTLALWLMGLGFKFAIEFNYNFMISDKMIIETAALFKIWRKSWSSLVWMHNLCDIFPTKHFSYSMKSNKLTRSLELVKFHLVFFPRETRMKPSRYLLVRSQQCKNYNNMWNLFKVSNKDTRTTSLTSLWCLYC